jgi:hypothetical protein
MKNLYVQPTDKPSRLFIDIDDKKLKICVPLGGEHMMNQHIHITSDEKINEGDWCLYNKNHDSKNPSWVVIKCGIIEREEMHPESNGMLLLWMIKIILTTDQDLINDGVHPINDEFLDWFVKNPNCERVLYRRLSSGYKIIHPQEKPKNQMITKITRQLAKELEVDFNLLLEDFVEDSYQEHRRGSNFYTQSIVEINEEYYPQVPRELDGFWETNSYVWDDNYGYDKSDITELTRVEKVPVIQTTYEWLPVEEITHEDMEIAIARDEQMGKEIVEYLDQYKGTPTYTEVAKALEFAYQLRDKYDV